jgi:hypothetical protein
MIPMFWPRSTTKVDTIQLSCTIMSHFFLSHHIYPPDITAGLLQKTPQLSGPVIAKMGQFQFLLNQKETFTFFDSHVSKMSFWRHHHDVGAFDQIYRCVFLFDGKDIIFWLDKLEEVPYTIIYGITVTTLHHMMTLQCHKIYENTDQKSYKNLLK